MATAPFSCFAVAAPGLEPIVARELSALGERARIEDGGVSWEGDARSLMRANLWLRTATRVLVRMAAFRAKTFHELERHARRIPWERFVAPNAPIDLRVTARKSKLYHSEAIEQRLRDSSKRPAANDAPSFIVRMFRDECEISADASGALLHMRGYRQAVAKAPLRETLAAALLLAAEWTGDESLLDPFCGSGTIPIEGAMIARRMAPGLRRRFAFMDWPDYDEALWRALIAEARTTERPTAGVPIAGSDRDAGAIVSARANAERAGVLADVEFTRGAVSAIRPPSATGLVATNPPYGVRASGQKDVRNLYAQFGNVLRANCARWRVALYSAQARLTRESHVPLETMFRTTNGGIKVVASVGRVGPAASTG